MARLKLEPCTIALALFSLVSWERTDRRRKGCWNPKERNQRGRGNPLALVAQRVREVKDNTWENGSKKCARYGMDEKEL